jgi:sulfite exporter TauE/SafE
MLVTGLLTSVHCVMMCGNMVLSYAVKGNEEGSLFRRMLPHFAYHSAKIVSYTLVGLLLGSIGSFITQDARSWVSVVAGSYMILLGLNMTGKFPILAHLTPRPPRFLMNALMKLRRKSNSDAASGESSITTPVTFGLMTGLMPCGPLQAAQIAAAGAGSTLAGGIGMLGFGLGTMPLMLGYGAVASYLSGRFKRYMAVAAAILIIGLGLVMMNRGATALGAPVNFNTIKQSVLGSGSVAVDESQFTTGSDGVVEIPLVIENVSYQPAVLAIPKDKPVRLVIDRRENNVCSDQLLIPNLGIQVALRPNGVTTVDLPASKAGSYQMTCQMGMMAGTLQVGGGAAKGGTSPVVPISLLVVAGGAAYWVYTRRENARREAEAARTHKGRKHTPPTTKSAPALWGLSPAEMMLTGVAVSLAAYTGLLLGGFFV